MSHLVKIMCPNSLRLYLLILYLAYSCTSAASENHVDATNKTLLSDLNWDVQLSIYERLDLIELISLVESNNHFLILAEDVFKRIFAKRTIKFTDNILSNDDAPIYETESVIFIRAMNILFKTLKYFGHTLTNFEVEYLHSTSAIVATNFTKISDLINMYCSDNTTIRFNIDCTVNDERFRRKIDFKTVSSAFPVVRVAQLKTMARGMARIGRQLPHLKHLYIHIWPIEYTERFTNADIEELLRKNPQIQSLRLKSCTPQFLKMINEVLPNLESLEVEDFIDEFDFDLDPIVFANLKKFIVNIGAADAVFERIRLVKLVELIGYGGVWTTTTHWVDFVKNSPTLKSLQTLFSDLNMLELKYSNLTEVYFQFGIMNPDEIIDFINNNKKLKRIQITFIAHKVCARAVEKFMQQISDRWTITALPLYIYLTPKF